MLGSWCDRRPRGCRCCRTPTFAAQRASPTEPCRLRPSSRVAARRRRPAEAQMKTARVRTLPHRRPARAQTKTARTPTRHGPAGAQTPTAQVVARHRRPAEAQMKTARVRTLPHRRPARAQTKTARTPTRHGPAGAQTPTAQVVARRRRPAEAQMKTARARTVPRRRPARAQTKTARTPTPTRTRDRRRPAGAQTAMRSMRCSAAQLSSSRGAEKSRSIGRWLRRRRARDTGDQARIARQPRRRASSLRR